MLVVTYCVDSSTVHLHQWNMYSLDIAFSLLFCMFALFAVCWLAELSLKHTCCSHLKCCDGKMSDCKDNTEVQANAVFSISEYTILNV